MTDTKLKILTLICFLMLSAIANAQEEDSLSFKLLSPPQLKNFGKNAMAQGDYSTASEYFERYLQIKPGKYRIAFKLAESYRNNRDYAQALVWYEKSYELSKETFIPPLYYHGLMLKMNGECTKAKVKFNDFRKKAGSDKKYAELKKQVKNQIQGCDSIALKNAFNKIAISHLDTSINKVHVEAAPFYLNDSLLLYSSLRTNKREFRYSGDSLNFPVRKLHRASRGEGNWLYDGELEGPFNLPGVNVGGGAFSPDQSRFYFTRCSQNWKGKPICAIWVTEKSGKGDWQEPEQLNKKINNPKYTSTQPTVSVAPDGLELVYFVSDRPGGKGGYDIWYFTFKQEKGLYSSPRNAGSKVNTTQDELSPYFDQEYRTLYFSSTGWPGMGGFDVFKAIGQFKKFTAPENVGQPVNSSYDDLYYTIAPGRETGMFVSNRKGGVSLKNPTCCDDLYEFKRLEFLDLKIAGNLTGGEDSLLAQQIGEAELNIYILNPETNESSFIKQVRVDGSGNFEFPVEAGNVYKLVVEKDGYWNSTSTINTKEILESGKLQKDFFLKEIPKRAFVLENVYYEFDKSNLTADSKNVLDTTLIVLLMENPKVKIEIGSYTDDKGTDAYNLKLSQRRAESVVKYLISKGIDPKRLIATGYGESMPIAPNKNADGSDNPQGRQKNRRTEFSVIGKVNLVEKHYEDVE